MQIQLLFEEATFSGFEKHAIKYCRWLLEMSDEERTIHHKSLAHIAHAVRTAHGQFWDITPECNCLMCAQWHSAAVKEIWNQAAAEKLAREKKRAEPRTLELTFIYLLLDERTGYVKIGRAKDPSSRERTLQSENPCVSMIYRGSADTRIEKDLHQEYAEFRVRGEWFKLSRAQIDEIIKRVSGTA